MNEQIVVTQGDYGIRININVIDTKKQPVDITGGTVEVTIIKADNSKEYVNAIIENATLGKAYFILTEEHTDVSGLCTCYVKYIDEYNNIHTQENIYYFVQELNGGVS